MIKTGDVMIWKNVKEIVKKKLQMPWKGDNKDKRRRLQMIQGMLIQYFISTYDFDTFRYWWWNNPNPTIRIDTFVGRGCDIKKHIVALNTELSL